MRCSDCGKPVEGKDEEGKGRDPLRHLDSDDDKRQGQGQQQGQEQGKQGQGKQGEGKAETPEEKAKREAREQILKALGLDPSDFQQQGQTPEEVQKAIQEAQDAARKAKEAQKKAEEEAEKAKQKAAGIPQKIEIHIPEQEPITPGQFTHENYALLLRLIKLGQNVLLVGPAGSGKTYAAEQALTDLGYAVFKMQAPHDPYDLIGFKDAGGTYQPTPLYRWATHQEKAGFILDEVDASNARALMPVSPALANGWAVFPMGSVQIPEGHICIATANTWGTGSGIGEYVGAQKQDGRILSRFPGRIAWGYDANLEEHICRKKGGDLAAWKSAVKIRANLEENGIRVIWGPRETIGVAQRVASGMAIGDALKCSALVSLDEDQYSRAIRGVA